MSRLKNLVINSKLIIMEENQIKLLEEAKAYVNETRKWLLFFGFIMLISILFILILGITFIIGGSSLLPEDLTANFPGTFGSMFGIVYIIIGIIMTIPMVYIFRAAKAGKKAVKDNDNEQMVQFLKNNKSYWKFTGIYTLIILAFAVIAIIGSLITLTAGSML